GKRRFLLHNVHDSEPVVFETRWVLSYLAGPLTREQIKSLAAARAGDGTDEDEGGVPKKAPPNRASLPVGARPVLPPEIAERFFPADGLGAEDIGYAPRLIAAAELTYESVRLGIDERRAVLLGVDVGDDAVDIDSGDAEPLDAARADLGAKPVDGARYEQLPPLLAK